MGRKSGTGVRSAALVAVGALAGFGCEGTPEDDYYGPLVYEVLPAEVSGPFALEFAFADGEMWQYANVESGIGFLDPESGEAVVPVPGKVYVMAGVEGQYPIIDALPGTLEYSAFWQVIEVEPPSGYKANQIKSLQTIEDADLKQTETDRYMHCPVVNPDAVWTSNLGVPVEALGLDPLPAQVILNIGQDMPNAMFEYAAQYGATVEEVFGFIATPIEEPVIDPETGEQATDEEGNPLFQVVWPGFEFDPEFVMLALSRQDQPFVTDDEATDFDVKLQPVWHKTLRGFCLPDPAETSYSATTNEFDEDFLAAAGILWDQWSPEIAGDPGDPKAEPPVPPTDPVPSASYGLLPIYNAAPGATGYSPVVVPTAVITETPEQVTDAADLDTEASLGPIAEPVHAPLIRKIDPGTIAGGN